MSEITYRKDEATHRMTRYVIHSFATNGPLFLALETGWSGNHGEWIALNEESVAWQYLTEKLPALGEREGDKEGWVMAFAEAGIEVFG